MYLLLGAAYAFADQIDWFVNPAVFDSSEEPVKSFVDWIYFSFCTLSKLGYGDIVPTSRMSRSLAIGEAITGQMYLAITIARLVAMQVRRSCGNERHRQKPLKHTVNPVRQLHPLVV